jgi:hypothetical protein
MERCEPDYVGWKVGERRDVVVGPAHLDKSVCGPKPAVSTGKRLTRAVAARGAATAWWSVFGSS